MQIASEVLTEVVTGFEEEQPYGLVAYGHRREKDCEDVEFMIPLENMDKSVLQAKLKSIKPLGRTPLAFSALQVIETIKSKGVRATIILITDGIESCGGDICDVIRKAKDAGIEFKVHIVGFGLKDDETEQLRCAAKAGDGQYFDAQSADELSAALDEVTKETIDDPGKNVSFYALKNGQPVDAGLKAYPKGSAKYNTSSRSYRDTGFLYLDPGLYDFVFYALENSDISEITMTNVEVIEGQKVHRDVSFDGGIIRINTTNNGEGWDAVVHINDSNTGKSVSGGRTYGKIKDYEVSPGTYKTKLNALRIKGPDITYEEVISVRANEVTEVGFDFKSGVARLGAFHDGERIDVVVTILEANTRKSYSGGRTYTSEGSNPTNYLLSPGLYEVTLKGLRDFSGVNKTFMMEIKAGETFEKLTEF